MLGCGSVIHEGKHHHMSGCGSVIHEGKHVGGGASYVRVWVCNT